MDTQDETDQHELAPIGDVASGSLPDMGSLLDALAASREETAKVTDTFIPIAGYEASGIMLYAKYRLMEGEELTNIGRKVASQFGKKRAYERQLYAGIDTMVEACLGLYVDRGDGKKVQMTNGGIPIAGYDANLAEALKFLDLVKKKDVGRTVVLGTFANNTISITQHTLMLGRWFNDASVDVSAEYLEATGNA